MWLLLRVPLSMEDLQTFEKLICYWHVWASYSRILNLFMSGLEPTSEGNRAHFMYTWSFCSVNSTVYKKASTLKEGNYIIFKAILICIKQLALL